MIKTVIKSEARRLGSARRTKRVKYLRSFDAAADPRRVIVKLIFDRIALFAFSCAILYSPCLVAPMGQDTQTKKSSVRNTLDLLTSVTMSGTIAVAYRCLAQRWVRAVPVCQHLHGPILFYSIGFSLRLRLGG
jgi:hypothetical protein